MTTDGGLQVEAENKVTVRGEEGFTLADLSVAARELAARGVPRGARVDVTMSMTGARWSVTAKWEPEPGIKLPEDPAPAGLRVDTDAEPDPGPVQVYPCGRCGKEIVKDGARVSGYRHVNPLGDKHPATRVPTLGGPQG